MFYSESAPQVVQSSLEDFDLTVSYSQYLSFKLAEYTFNGTYLGLSDLSDQLTPCDMSFDDVLSMKRFGVILEKNCMFSLNTLLP